MKMIYVKLPILIFAIHISISVNAAKDSIQSFNRGRQLFNTNCSSCHAVNKELIGPMLASVPKKRPKGWLNGFIKNSQELLAAGDSYAEYLFEEYNHTVMPSFMELTENDIKDILTYIESESIRPTAECPEVAMEKRNNTDPEVLEGETLFRAHCSSCHHVEREAYGPALGSVTKRRPKDWLIKFVHNSRDVINSGDPYAVHLYNNFDKKRMPEFLFLSENEINTILTYIEHTSASASQIAGVNGRKNLKEDYGTLMSVYSYPYTEVDQGNEIFYKIFFSFVTALVASFHSYTVYRVFRYLSRKEIF